MEDSILDSVKKLLGIDPSYYAFDADITMHINSVFSILTQLGVGPERGFRIHDKNAVWTSYLAASEKLEMVKTYMALKVRMMFDPPMSSSVADAINRNISELEWRINVAVDPGEEN